MMMRRTLTLLALALSSLAAHADAREWRLLGPAFSYHASSEMGYIVKPGTATSSCSVVSQTTSADGSSTRRDYTCAEQVSTATTAFNQTNWGLGLEVSEVRDEGYRDFAYVNVLQDSYAQPGVMAGVGRKWPLGQAGSVKFEMGGSIGLWYRTVADGTVGDGTKVSLCFKDDPVYGTQCRPGTAERQITKLERKLVPFVLPMLTLTDKRSGLGVDIALAPEMHMGGIDVCTTTIMVQLSYALN